MNLFPRRRSQSVLIVVICGRTRLARPPTAGAQLWNDVKRGMTIIRLATFAELEADPVSLRICQNRLSADMKGFFGVVKTSTQDWTLLIQSGWQLSVESNQVEKNCLIYSLIQREMLC